MIEAQPLVPSPHTLAVSARCDARTKRVVVKLANGASFAFPPHLAKGLTDAQAADLAVIELSSLGTGLHWPRRNVDLTVEGLLVGVFGSRAWMRQHAAKGGRPRKTVALHGVQVMRAKFEAALALVPDVEPRDPQDRR